MRTVTEKRGVSGTICGVQSIAQRVVRIFSSADVWTWALRGELNDSSGSFSYITPSSDQDMDDVTLGCLLLFLPPPALRAVL